MDFGGFLVQQNGIEACGFADKAIEEQEGCTGEADEEGIGPVA